MNTEAIIDDVVGGIRQGMVPAYVYSDPDVFELERERLFGTAWVFLAHESEIPIPATTSCAGCVDDSFIVVRDEARRGCASTSTCACTAACRCAAAEVGNASHFRCPYHGWTYRNDGPLAGLPFHQRRLRRRRRASSRTEQHLLPAAVASTPSTG